MRYVIRKIASDLLFYVDRNKTKRMWWSYDCKYALLYTSKEEAQSKANSLNFGKFEVITETKLLKALKEFMSTRKSDFKVDYNESISLSDYLNRY